MANREVTQPPESETGPVHAEQHPALRGEPDVEVAERSADGSSGTTFRKTFVVKGEFDKKHPMHEYNCVRVLEEATQRGLHPKGEAKLAKVEASDPDRRGNVSTECTYEVEVVPSIVDHEAHTTVTPSSEVRAAKRRSPE